MVDVASYTLIAITCFCFGLIVSVQIGHIRYCRKLAGLVKRSIASKTIAPILAEFEALKPKV